MSTLIEERAAKQKAYCEEKGYPLFAPLNGGCWNCRKNIYEKLDGESFITSCPHCHRSYCD